VREFFPESNITPLDFRRIIPSLIFDVSIKLLHLFEKEKEDIWGKSLSDFLDNYALLVNTSSSVS
jgi:hypothetical protein